MEVERVSSILLQLANYRVLPFERDFSNVDILHFIGSNYHIPIGSVTLYVLFLFFGSRVMASRQPFGLRNPLAAWNAFLCLFSFIGVCRTVPYLLWFMLSASYEDTVCKDPEHTWASGPVGLWVVVFMFSKIPELIDTVFVVLKKKPLIFLHWYHHITVLLFCWNAYATMAATGIYFVAMNYTVHTFMYGYYCAQALGVLPKSFPAYLITLAQILQMLGGTALCASAWYYKLSGKPCHNDMSNLTAGAVIYASYLYLFCDFALKKFGGKAKKGAAAIKKE